MTLKKKQVHTQSLPLTMDFSNLWNHCYRFTHAFFTQCKTTCLSAICAHCLAALPATDVYIHQSHAGLTPTIT